MRRFFALLASNWQLKALALALALLLWVVVSGEQPATETISIPVEVVNRDPGYVAVAGPVPDRVDLRLSGPRRDFLQLAVSRPPLRLEIDEVTEEEQFFRVGPEMVRIPGALAVTPLDVRPSRVHITFQRIERREVPVAVRFGARFPEEAVVEDVRVSPDRVVLIGPPDRMEGLAAVPTLPVQLAEDDTTFVLEVELDPAALEGLQASVTRVSVRGRTEAVEELRLERVPVAVPGNYLAAPPSVAVLLRGGRSRVAEVDPGAVRAVVPRDSIPAVVPEGTLGLPLQVEGLPEGVAGVAEPARVQIVPIPTDQPPPPDPQGDGG